MTLPEAGLDPARCPICGEANGCAMASGSSASTCWCYSAEISDEAMARVPPDAQGLVCICARCAAPPSSGDLA